MSDTVVQRSAVGFIGIVAVSVYHPSTASYLVLRRSGSVDIGTGEWETITGRVEHGESFEDAARREVREELAVDVDLDFIIGTAHFYRGDRDDEHEALGVRYACSLSDRGAIALSSEHDAQQWLTAGEIATTFPPDHRIRRAVERAEALRAALPPEIISLQQREGFLSE